MAKILSKKRWYRLVPIAFITFSLAFLDRANFGFALAGGMAEDLDINATIASLLGSLFFLGYFFFQIPGTLYASNKSAKRLIFWSMILWGLLSMATGMVNNVNYLIIIRFMLGVAESAVMPSMLIFLSNWFTKSERSKANTFLILGSPATMLWMSVLSGYLIELVGWRWMFIIEGFPAIIWAFFWWWLVDDKVRDAKWLNETEKSDLEEQLLQEQQAIKPVKNYRIAFKSRVVILLSVQYALWNAGAFGFIMWLPSIIKKVPDISIVNTGWLSAVPYLFAIIGMLFVSYFSDKTQKRKVFIWPFLLIGAIAFYCSYLIGDTNFWLSFVLLVVAGIAMYAPYAPFFALITEILPRNVAGGAIALINSLGALGSFAGAYLVGYLNGVTSGFGASYIFMSGSLFLSAILTIIAVGKQNNDINKRVKVK